MGDTTEAAGRRRPSATGARPGGPSGAKRATRPRGAQAEAGSASRPSARRPAEEAQEPSSGAGWMSGLGGLLRGSGGMLGQISGIEGPARSLERLAQSAERATAMLDQVEREVGLDRLIGALELLERLTAATEEMRDSVLDMRQGIRQIEERVVDLHARLTPPLDRLPLRRGRGRKAGPGA